MESAEQAKTWSIYVLIDPRSGAVKYVGKTTNPQQRKSAHDRGSEGASSEALNTWFTDLEANGLKPIMTVLMSGLDEPTGAAKETEMILLHRQSGELLNFTDGPCGGPRKGAGRPKAPPSTLLTVRLPVSELAAYAAKAAANHEFLSVVVRRLLEAWLRG